MAPRRRFDLGFKERVLRFAEQNSGEETARHFNIDSKRIRDWRRQKEELLLADRGRARLAGGGRKRVSVELERRLSEWIHLMRAQQNRVSRNTIKKKALEIYASVSDGGKTFVASTGWLQRFLQRNSFSSAGPVDVVQGDPRPLPQRLASFVASVGRTVSSGRISEADIIAMDEMAVCFDVVYAAAAGRSEAPKTRRPKESHLSVVLAAKADGTKLKPYLVFRGAVSEVMAMQQQVSAGVVASSSDGFMNDALTADWLQTVVGRVSAAPRLLVWDSYRCHLSDATEEELRRGYNITAAVIPRGCARLLQPADLMWNQVFKQGLQDAYDHWASGDQDKDYSPEGLLNVPARRLLVDWVLAAWDRLDQDLIRKSFKVCGLSVRPDGSEDHLLLCLGEGGACAAGWEELRHLRQERRSEEEQGGAV